VLFLVVAAVVVFLTGIQIVRPVYRALIERLGKYRRFAKSGFNWVIPQVDRMNQVNITEQITDGT
jgi:regulator of protease activity HflC (stomatin/prohibitin superfamily)